MRIRSLDGLRGVAALIVVFHHALLTLPAFASVYFDRTQVVSRSTAWFMGFTPLHVFWAGGEAVFVFFVLSGLVLALPWMSDRKSSWLKYYTKRALRLYLPVWAAIAFALATIRVSPRGVLAIKSSWLSIHPAKVNRTDLLNDLLLIQRTNVGTNSVLWSLRWEVRFSLTLPVWIACALIVRKFRMQLPALVLLLIATFLLGGNQSLLILLILAVGVILSTDLEAFSRRLSLSTRLGGWRAIVGLGFVVLLTTWRWCRLGLGMNGVGRLTVGLDNLCVVLAAILAVCLSVASPGWGWALERRLPQYLGSRSFSLYLVHEPIVVAFAYLQHGKPSVVVLVSLTLPAILLVTELFYRIIEQPSLRAASAVSRKTVRLALR